MWLNCCPECWHGDNKSRQIKPGVKQQQQQQQQQQDHSSKDTVAPTANVNTPMSARRSARALWPAVPPDTQSPPESEEERAS
ncbi:unnamed protein product, partial [Ectocarpus sp. 4 AP-2014]